VAVAHAVGADVIAEMGLEGVAREEERPAALAELGHEGRERLEVLPIRQTDARVETLPSQIETRGLVSRDDTIETDLAEHPLVPRVRRSQRVEEDRTIARLAEGEREAMVGDGPPAAARGEVLDAVIRREHRAELTVEAAIRRRRMVA